MCVCRCLSFIFIGPPQAVVFLTFYFVVFHFVYNFELTYKTHFNEKKKMSTSSKANLALHKKNIFLIKFLHSMCSYCMCVCYFFILILT